MKNILIFALLLCVIRLNAQTYEIFPNNTLDSIYYYSGDSISWLLDSKYSISERNDDGFVTNAYNMFWNNSDAIWSLKDSIHTIYFEDNSKEKEIIFPWNSNSNTWADTLYFIFNNKSNNTVINFARYWNYNKNIGKFAGEYTIKYLDSDSNIVKKTDKTWWKNLNSWVNTKNTKYNYQNNNLKTEILQQWRPNTNEWRNKSKFYFEYDSYDRELLKIRYTWSSNKWKSRERDTTIYESDDLIITINQAKKGNNDTWINNKKTLKQFKDSVLLKETIQVWENEKWRNDHETTYTYDSLGRIQTIIQQSWEQSRHKLINAYSSEYIYENNSADYIILNKSWHSFKWHNINKKEFIFIPNKNLIKSYSYYKWDSNYNYWKNISKKVNFYSAATLIDGISPVINEEINIFPNPTSDYFQITEKHLNANDIIEIYSLNGNLVLHQKIGAGNINIKSLNKGIYFIKIIGKKQYKTQKLVIEK